MPVTQYNNYKINNRLFNAVNQSVYSQTTILANFYSSNFKDEVFDTFISQNVGLQNRVLEAMTTIATSFVAQDTEGL
jgi:hypothetical protein